ncbi:hypothetical protein PIB30_107303, partial [Stylosanthes scabra]|nr:hypothetical protein [Stylosanthes scabra]
FKIREQRAEKQNMIAKMIKECSAMDRSIVRPYYHYQSQFGWTVTSRKFATLSNGRVVELAPIRKS